MSKLGTNIKPINNDQRICTDCLCLIIYITLTTTIFTLTCHSLSTYSLYSLITPTDSDGQTCGISLENHPYLYFVSPHVDSIGRRVCVSQCPINQFAQLNCSFNSAVGTCDFTYSDDHQKNVQIYPTQLQRSPGQSVFAIATFDEITNILVVTQKDEKIVEIGNNWRLILTAVPVAIGITLLILLIMRYTACVSVYLLLLIIVGLLFLLAFYFFACSLQASQQPQYFQESISKQSLLMIMAVTIFLMGIVIFVLFCYNRKRINIAVKLIKSSAKFVNQHWYLLSISLIQCLYGLVFMLWWILQLWGVIKAKQFYIRNNQVQISPQMDNFLSTIIVVIHAFYLLWTYYMITQTANFIVSGTVTNWYYGAQKNNTCCSSFDRYTGYHLGSVCAASFFLSIFGIFTFLLQWLRSCTAHRRQTLFTSQSDCSNLFCLQSVSKLITICNRGAYALIHMDGKNYSESSSKVLSLRLCQPVLSSTMTFIELIFSLILRIQVVIITIFWGYKMLQNDQPSSDQQQQDWTLTLSCIAAIAFFVSKTFLTIYSQATDALIVCLLLDKDEQNGFEHCPQQLKQQIQQILHQQQMIL